MDNGVDLKDRKIKHIFTEIVDVDTMMQSLGRKRSLAKDDICYFYIRLYQKKGLQGFINRINYHLEPVELYKTDYEAFYKKYGDGKQRDRLNKNKIFYNLFKKKNIYGQIKVNECKFRKYSQDYDMFTSMKEFTAIKCDGMMDLGVFVVGKGIFYRITNYGDYEQWDKRNSFAVGRITAT